MGWLFGRKKKKKVSSSLQDDKTLSFGSNDDSGNLIKPDQFKAAAGLDAGFSESVVQDTSMGDSSEALSTDVWGQLDQGSIDVAPGQASMMEQEESEQVKPLGTGLPVTPNMQARRLSQDYKHIQVQQYKRILGELKDLNSELSHMGSLGKSLDKAEYNEEKHFLRLKEIMRKVHDKTLHADRVLFSSH